MPTEVIAAYREYREHELRDAVITAAVLMASAGGSLPSIERHHLIDVLADEGFLFAFTREELLEAFERELRDIRQAKGLTAGVDRLKRFAGNPLADFVTAVAEEIAAVDCRLRYRKQPMLTLVRTALGVPFPPRVLTSHARDRTRRAPTPSRRPKDPAGSCGRT